MTRIAVILKVRNEEGHLEETIRSVLDQDLRPCRIIAINDGSTDGTRDVILRFPEIEIIDNPVRSESHLGQKEMPAMVNQGLERLHGDELDYVWISDGDLVYPASYASEITSRMRRDGIAISSGVVEGEFSVEPRGGLRVVDWEFWKRLGMLYPVNYGYEGYLILKARSLGYSAKIYPDMVVTTHRSTGTGLYPKRYYYDGLAYRALGYTVPFMLAKSLLFSVKKPRGALAMLRGYFSGYDDLYEPELREFVRRSQRVGASNAGRFLRTARKRQETGR